MKRKTRGRPSAVSLFARRGVHVTWEGEWWRRMRKEERDRRVAKHGEEVVAAWEFECERYPLVLANYNNVKHLLHRDGYDDGPPAYPTLEAVAARLKKT